MVSGTGRQKTDLLWLANALVLAVVLNQLASLYFFRIDLTEEGRYKVKKPTREMLRDLDDDVYIEVYLEGELNAGFRRLRKAASETLEEFRIYSGNKVHYRFSDPMLAKGQNAQREFMMALASKGIQPTEVIEEQDGQRSRKLVFPGALVSYEGQEAGVMLLRGNRAQGSEESLNQSIEGLEYEFSNAIHKLANTSRKKIGVIKGHEELDTLQMASLYSAMSESYDVLAEDLSGRHALDGFDVIVLAKPMRNFSEAERYRLDQYLVRGGKMLWLIDRLQANMDSVSRDDYFAHPVSIGLDDQLFHYGVRLNPDLVQDRVSLRYPIVTGTLDGKPQMTPIEWPFFPLINHYADHPSTRNLDATALKFVSSIDTVKAVGIRKTPLMFTSSYSRKVMSPVKLNVADLRKEITPENFSAGPVSVAYLLEGKFTSIFRNRFLPEGVDSSEFKVIGRTGKLIVIADGDVARNDINQRTGQPQPLGYDNYSSYTFANQQLILNLIAFLVDEDGLISTRTKQVKVRPLDRERIRNDRAYIQTINVAAPLALIILFGLAKSYVRKKKYASFKSVRDH
jgi:ABC-2 type transport system permease protein